MQVLTKTWIIMGFSLLLLLLSLVEGRPQLFPPSSHSPPSGDMGHLVKDIGPLKGLIRVSDEVVEGMRAEKYRVPSLTHWPDGSPAPKEAAPYVIIGVPDEQYTN